MSESLNLGERYPHGITGGQPGFPFPSMRAVMRSRRWPHVDGAPAMIAYAKTVPNDEDAGWTDELQGATHDESSWYFIRSRVLVKINRDDAFMDDPDDITFLSQRVMPDSKHADDRGYTHLSGGAFRDGLGFAIAEADPGEGGRAGAPPALYVFTPMLGVIAAIALDQGGGPWCSLTPDGRYLLSSSFDPGMYDHINVYRMPSTEEIMQIASFQASPEERAKPYLGDLPKLEPLRKITLFEREGGPMILTRLQGGVVTPNYHLWLVNDARPGYAGGIYSTSLLERQGVLGFDLVTGRLVVHQPISMEWTGAWNLTALGDELEGITYWDLGDRGALHVIKLNNDVGTDNVSIIHLRAWDTAQNVLL